MGVSLVLMALLGAGAPLFAAVTFTVEDCSSALAGAEDSTPAAERMGGVLASWVRMTHPEVKAAMANAPSQDVQFDLMYAATGFAIPPASHRSYWERSSRLQDSFDRVVSFRASEGRAVHGDLGRKLLTERFQNKDSNVALATLLTQSFQVLELLTKDSGFLERTSRRTGPERLGTEFPIAAPLEKQVVTLNWPSEFLQERFVPLRVLLRGTQDLSVRRALIRQVSRELQTIVEEYRALCSNVAKCSSTAEFYSAYTKTKFREERPEAGDGRATEDFNRLKPSMAQVAAAPTALPPPPPTMQAESFSSESFDTFVRARRLTATRLSEVSFAAVWNDLQSANDLLNLNFARLFAWRYVDQNIEEWREAATGRVDSVPVLIQLMNHSRANIGASQKQFEVGERALESMKIWFRELNETLTRLEKDEKSLEAMSETEKFAMTSVMKRLPLLEQLSDQMYIAIQTHRRVLLERLNNIGHVSHLLGGAMVGGMPDLSTDQFDQTQGHRKLTEALDLLVGVGREE